MATNRERTYRPIAGIPQQLKEEIRLIWDGIYDLRDSAKFDIQFFLLTRPTQIDFPTYKGKPALVIIQQDATGGRVIRFASKFKGINSIIWDTTPNTYSCVLMYPLQSDLVMCVAGVTGGEL